MYNGVQLEENNTVGIIFDAFDNHFIGKTNETYERYVFNKRDQKTDESFRDSCFHVKHLKDPLLRHRLVLGIKNDSTRKRSLKEDHLNLKSCVDMRRAA